MHKYLIVKDCSVLQLEYLITHTHYTVHKSQKQMTSYQNPSLYDYFTAFDITDIGWYNSECN